MLINIIYAETREINLLHVSASAFFSLGRRSEDISRPAFGREMWGVEHVALLLLSQLRPAVLLEMKT